MELPAYERRRIESSLKDHPGPLCRLAEMLPEFCCFDPPRTWSAWVKLALMSPEGYPACMDMLDDGEAARLRNQAAKGVAPAVPVESNATRRRLPPELCRSREEKICQGRN